MRRPKRRAALTGGAFFVLAFLPIAVCIASSACGTAPVGIESCQKIEKVRCESALACGISLDHPAATGSSDESKVASCIRYYDDQCLHGLAIPTDPGPQAVQKCVDAIINGTCDVVRAPETDPSCSFLVPAVVAVVDAAADADATVTTVVDAAPATVVDAADAD